MGGLAATARNYAARFQKRVWLLQKTAEQWAEILVLSWVSETLRPWPECRDTAMDRAVPAHRELWRKTPNNPVPRGRGSGSHEHYEGR